MAAGSGRGDAGGDSAEEVEKAAFSIQHSAFSRPQSYPLSVILSEAREPQGAPKPPAQHQQTTPQVANPQRRAAYAAAG
jgi:hypothetical protein